MKKFCSFASFLLVDPAAENHELQAEIQATPFLCIASKGSLIGGEIAKFQVKKIFFLALHGMR